MDQSMTRFKYIYHADHICCLENIDQIYIFIEFSIPWIHKWTPEIGFTEEDIPCLYRTYYNNFWDKLMKQEPKTKQLIGQELLDSISEKIKEYTQIPQKGIVNNTSVRHIARRISFQEGDKEKIILDYLEEVRKNLLQTITQIDKSDTLMRSETNKPQQHQNEFYLLDYIQAFDKVLYYNNDKHKHTWFIKVCAKIFAEPIPNWFINWWSYHGPTVQILPEPFLNLYKEWTKIISNEFSIPWIHKWTLEIGFTEEDIPCLYRTYYNNFWDKLMKQDPKTK
ncbi:hypothetical protein H5410_041191 [Solanum commersonii]|uniref:Uncharacterized protein n=1 Tax=Solanum commersonii TaxID=4109 RepID=A0A9J5XSA8_SOLCO|nr:hypothetical protein H5410_041191 [Solanum commersonii]